MAEYPSLPLFTDAFISDTTHLNATQTGAYIMLLMAAWRSSDCSLPDDDKILSRIARMDGRSWSSNKSTIMAFWKKNAEHKWYQARLVDERKYVDDMRRKNAAAGKSSALKRKERHSTSVQPKLNENSTPTPTPTPIDNTNVLSPPIVPQGNTSKKEKSDYSDAFLEAWPIYPSLRRGDKSSAWRAWQKAIKAGYTEQQILEGVKNYAASDEASGRYAKGYPAWLNDCRFTWSYKPMGSQAGNATRGNRGFDALAVAATKIQESMDRDDELLRQTNPVLYYQRLANQSGRENSIAGSLEAPNTIEHDAAPIGIGYREED